MMKDFIRNSLLSGDFILSVKKGYRFIFIYHDISDTDSPHHSPLYSTTRSNFQKQITFLSNYFHFIDLDSITREEPYKENVASIVFDDGFKSVETTALEILEKRSIPFAVFLNRFAVEHNRLWVSDLVLDPKLIENYKLENRSIDDLNYRNLVRDAGFNNSIPGLDIAPDNREQIYLNAVDILRLKEKGITIGNHGACHLNLALCNTANLEREIAGNKIYLESLIGAPVKHYAYAFGKKEYYTKQVIAIIKESGHELAYTSNPAGFKSNFNKYLIPRIGLTNESPQRIMFYINRQFIKNIAL